MVIGMHMVIVLSTVLYAEYVYGKRLGVQFSCWCVYAVSITTNSGTNTITISVLELFAVSNIVEHYRVKDTLYDLKKKRKPHLHTHGALRLSHLRR